MWFGSCCWPCCYCIMSPSIGAMSRVSSLLIASMLIYSLIVTIKLTFQLTSRCRYMSLYKFAHIYSQALVIRLVKTSETLSKHIDFWLDRLRVSTSNKCHFNFKSSIKSLNLFFISNISNAYRLYRLPTIVNVNRRWAMQRRYVLRNGNN